VDYMVRALRLAERARRTCKPNPAVGAIVVRDGRIVGEGFTQPVGGAHAEIKALEQAGELAHGAALYVTLEPCSHHGRTGPCVDAVITAGIREVHVAMVDPSPWVAGRGVDRLIESRISVSIGSYGDEARQLNEAYFTWVERGRPLVVGVSAAFPPRAALSLNARDLSESGNDLRLDVDRIVFDSDDAEISLNNESWLTTLQALAAQQVQSLILVATSKRLYDLEANGLVDRILGADVLTNDPDSLTLVAKSESNEAPGVFVSEIESCLRAS
jgi:pyrimidine deaminase RibD-like protein